MICPVVVDLRNIYRPEGMARYGFIYDSVGRSQLGHPRTALNSELDQPELDRGQQTFWLNYSLSS